jgi:hypothetical protein
MFGGLQLLSSKFEMQNLYQDVQQYIS